MALAALVLILAAACAVISRSGAKATGWKTFWGVAALILAVLGVLYVISALKEFRNRSAWEAQKIAEKRAEVAAITPEIVRIRETRQNFMMLATMPQIVLDILRTHPSWTGVLPGNAGPLPAIMTDWGEVPYWFIDKWYLANSGRVNLTRIRGVWPKAGNEENYAMWLQRQLVKWEMIEYHASNEAGRWLEGGEARFAAYYYGERINVVKTFDEPPEKDGPTGSVMVGPVSANSGSRQFVGE